MNRLAACFALLKARRRKAFLIYTVACDPSFEESLERLFTCAVAGVDAIEIGFPFSDPILDGDTIREAHQRALTAGGNLARTLELCAAFRRRDMRTPLILMGYAAPLVHMGYAAFGDRAEAGGVDGLIVADMPLREADELLAALAPHLLVMIPLTAPNLPATDSVTLRPGLGGFLYCIPVVGSTGGPSASLDDVEQAVARGRATTNLPLLVGFGIKTPRMAAEVARLCDGVIVATSLFDQILVLNQQVSTTEHHRRVVDLIAAYRATIDAAPEEKPG